MKRRRVKITGLGPVSAVGTGKKAFGEGLASGRSGVSVLRDFIPEAGPFVAAQVASFDLTSYIEDPSLKRLPRHTQFAIAGMLMALADAGITLAEASTLRPAVIIGATLMDFGLTAETILRVERKGPKAALPRAVLQAPTSSISASVAKLIGGKTRTLAIQSACCSGMDSIGHAAELIANGEVDLAVCGGTEAPLLQCPMIELKLVGLAPSTDESPERIGRPFDRWRTTGVIGEGAGIVVLEPETSPRPGYAWVDGYSYCADEDCTAPGCGVYDAAKIALANASCRPSEIDLVSAWGPGHRIIDRIEAEVLASLFGQHLSAIPVASIKGAVGNPLAAAGALQAIAVSIGFNEKVIFPTANWQYPDPECPLNLSSSVRHAETSAALINAHGISGMNSCLVLRSF